MMVYPSMLISAAEQAGMKCPTIEELGKKEKVDKNKYPHFSVFCTLQLGRSIQWGEQFENAKIIAAFSEEELKKATLEDFLKKGLHWQQ